MDAKATVQLDDMEMELIIQALTNASDDEKRCGNIFNAKLNEILARKIICEKVRFEDKYVKILEEKYGIKEEKPA